MLDRRCLVGVYKEPHHRAERAHAEADYNEKAAFENYINPETGHRAGPEVSADTSRRPCMFPSPALTRGEKIYTRHPVLDQPISAMTHPRLE